jgi:hypothetical protein
MNSCNASDGQLQCFWIWMKEYSWVARFYRSLSRAYMKRTHSFFCLGNKFGAIRLQHELVWAGCGKEWVRLRWGSCGGVRHPWRGCRNRRRRTTADPWRSGSKVWLGRKGPVHVSEVRQGMVRRRWGSGGTKISPTSSSSCPHPWRGHGGEDGRGGGDVSWGSAGRQAREEGAGSGRRRRPHLSAPNCCGTVTKISFVRLRSNGGKTCNGLKFQASSELISSI